MCIQKKKGFHALRFQLCSAFFLPYSIKVQLHKLLFFLIFFPITFPLVQQNLFLSHGPAVMSAENMKAEVSVFASVFKHDDFSLTCSRT